jgi:hypothetical protein
MDIASVLGCVHHDRISVQVDGRLRSIPDWADWLIWLGAWARCQAAMEGRRMVVVRLPSRKLSAAFVSLGALLAASRIHDDSLDWGALQALPGGTTVYWREVKGGNSKNYTGTVDSVRDVSGSMCLAISIGSPKNLRGATFLLPRSTALAYCVTLRAVTKSTEEHLTSAAGLFQSVVDGAPQSWIRSPGADSTIVTERTSFLADLSGLGLVAERLEAVAFEEALVISSVSNQQHGKLQLIASRARFVQEATAGITVLDGATAAIFLNSTRSRSVVLLLDHSEYDEELVHLINPFAGSSIDAGIHVPTNGVAAPPVGVEVSVLGLQDDLGDGA